MEEHLHLQAILHDCFDECYYAQQHLDRIVVKLAELELVAGELEQGAIAADRFLMPQLRELQRLTGCIADAAQGLRPSMDRVAAWGKEKDSLASPSAKTRP